MEWHHLSTPDSGMLQDIHSDKAEIIWLRSGTFDVGSVTFKEISRICDRNHVSVALFKQGVTTNCQLQTLDGVCVDHVDVASADHVVAALDVSTIQPLTDFLGVSAEFLWVARYFSSVMPCGVIDDHELH